MVYREQGRGTFVAEPKMRGVIGFASFSEEMIAHGLNPSSVVLSEVIRVNNRLPNALKLSPEECTLHLVRLRLVDGKPVAYQASYLPHRLCPGWKLSHSDPNPCIDLARKPHQPYLDGSGSGSQACLGRRTHELPDRKK